MKPLPTSTRCRALGVVSKVICFCSVLVKLAIAHKSSEHIPELLNFLHCGQFVSLSPNLSSTRQQEPNRAAGVQTESFRSCQIRDARKADDRAFGVVESIWPVRLGTTSSLRSDLFVVTALSLRNFRTSATIRTSVYRNSRNRCSLEMRGLNRRMNSRNS